MPVLDLPPPTIECEPPREPSDMRQLRMRWEDADRLPRTTLGWIPFLWRRVLFPGSPQGTTAWRWSSWLTLVILGGTLLLPWVGFPLFEPDEGRYAQIPFEMLTRGEWLAPTLQGEPYLDKPPLFYWSVMLAYRILGVHDWAARLVPAFAVLASVLLTYGMGRRLTGERAAFWGALTLLLAPGFIGTGRLLVLDGLLTLWVTMSIFAAALAVQASRLHYGWWLAASLACGLGVLTKGPVAILLLVPPLVAHRRLTGSTTRIGWRGWSMFAGVVLAVALPWYVAVTITLPEFGGYFFWKHNVLRFVQPFDHERPVWFYVPLILIGLLPFTLLLPAFVRWLVASDEAALRSRCPALGYLLLAGGWCVFFFSMSGCKLPTYILPGFPPVCLALGVFFARTDWHSSVWLRTGVVGTALFILAGHAWLAPAVAWQRSPTNTSGEVMEWCRDPQTPVFCFPRNVDSMAFYAGRSDFRTYRSKALGVMLEELNKHPRAVVLFAHRNSLGTLRHHLPPHLRISEHRPLGLCAMAVVERNTP
ncbi:MAG: glycosyltransferase family 39 protein [Gemmataceae bacterium]|nr:glycosyltransferase family 39 protein [Gemmataceae bacterium]